MPRRSKIELSQETIAELEDKFFDFLSSLNASETKNFFSEFLTDEEKMMMYKRLALYWSLLEGYPLSKIQQTIGVTHDTTRIYNKKKNGLSHDFKLLLKRITANEEAIMAQQPTYEEPRAEGMPIQQQEFTETVDEEAQPVEVNVEPQLTDSMPIMEETVISEEVKPEFSNEISSNEESIPVDQSTMDETPHIQPFETEDTENQNQDIQATNDSETEKQNEKQDEQPQKKKGGLAKFFGF